MGVPIFCILLGFPTGWYIAKREYRKYKYSDILLQKILSTSALTSAFTFLLTVIIWGRMVLMLFDPIYDFNNFGHPFILYDPKSSFIGWMFLMIFISPFLQLLTTIFASYITLIKLGKERNSNL
jgi:prolipoprotein diacylglyceryltransferase